jgi:hypothetical protein
MRRILAVLRTAAIVATLLVQVVLSPTVSFSQTVWQADEAVNSGNWTDANHWTMGVPTSTSHVTIDLDAGTNYSVVLNTSPTIASFVLESPFAQFILGSGRSLTVTSDATITDGAVNFTNASLTSNQLYFNGDVTLNVDGATLHGTAGLENTGNLNIAGAGPTTFTSSANGTIRNLSVINETSTGGLSFTGFGTFINSNQLTSNAGVALGITGASTGTRTATNSGTITAEGGLGVSSVTTFTNSGSILLGGDAGFSAGTFTNSGTIAIAEHKTVTISNTVLENTGGTFQGRVGRQGNVVLNNSTLRLGSGFNPNIKELSLINTNVEGGGTLTVSAGTGLYLRSNSPTSPTRVGVPLTNHGVVFVEDDNNFTEDSLVNESDGLFMMLGASQGPVSLGVLSNSGITNRGAFSLEGAASATLSLSTGAFVNESSGTFSFSSGGARTFVGDLDNRGQMLVSGPLSMTKNGGEYSNSGQIIVSDNDSLTVMGLSTFTNTGQITAGLSVSLGFSGIANGSSSFANTTMISAGGAMGFSSLATVTNSGTMIMDGGGGVGAGVTFSNSGTIEIASSRTLSITGATLINNGGTIKGRAVGVGSLELTDSTLTAGGGFAPDIGTLELVRSTIDGSGTVTITDRTFLYMQGATAAKPNRITVPLVNEGEVYIVGDFNTLENSVENAVDSKLLVTDASKLTAQMGITNRGEVQLITDSGTTTLEIAAGHVFTNESEGTFKTIGSSGTRRLVGDLQNDGLMRLEASLTMDKAGGTYVNDGRIEATFNSPLTVSNFSSFTNNDEIVALAGSPLAFSGASASSSTFTNTGTIRADAGISFSNLSTVDNSGTITAENGIGLNNIVVNNTSFDSLVLGNNSSFSGSTLNNSGAIKIAAGKTFTVSSSTLNNQGGVIQGRNGQEGSLLLDNSELVVGSQLSPNLSSWTLFRSQIQGAGSIANPSGTTLTVRSNTSSDVSRVSVAMTNAGNIVILDDNSVFDAGGTSLVNEASGTITVSGNAFDGSAVLIAQAGVVNRGMFKLTSSSASHGATITLNTGSFINEDTGTLAVEAASGGTRNINSHIDNRGTMTVDRPLSLTRSSGEYLNSGQITVGPNSSLSYSNVNSFSNSGQITAASTSPIGITGIANSTAQNAGTITAEAGISFSALQTVSNTGTVAIGGNSSVGSGVTFNNNGTIAIGAGRTFTMSAGATLNNQGGGSFQGRNGTEGFLMFDNATLDLSGQFSPDVSTWTLHRSTTQGGGSINNESGTTLFARSTTSSDFNRVLVPITNAGTLTVTGQYNSFEYAGGASLTNDATGDVSLSSSASDGSATLVVQSGVANRGTFRLISATSSASATLTLNTGAFVNEAGGLLAIEAGAGGGRTITAHLDNLGQMTVNRALSMSKAGGNYTNSGQILIGPSSSLSVSSLNQFNNSGSISAAAGSAISLTGASTTSSTVTNSGTITAEGGISFFGFQAVANTGTVNVGANSSVSSPMTNSGTIAIAAGRTFTVGSGATFTQQSGGAIQGRNGQEGLFLLDDATLHVSAAFAPNVASWTIDQSFVHGGGSIANVTTANIRGTSFSDINRVLVPVTNAGTMTVLGFYNQLEYAGGTTLVNEANHTFSIAGNATDSDAKLTVANGVTNRGTFRLTSSSSRQAQLVLTNGTFLNEVGGTLAIEPGGGRTFTGHLTNQGTVTIGNTISLTRTNGNYSNSGTIAVGANSPFSVNSINSFDNTSAGQLSSASTSAISLVGASSATSTLSNSGLITAEGGLSLGGFQTVTNTGTMNVGGNSSVSSPLTNSGTIAIAAGKTFTVNGTTFTPQTGGAIQGRNGTEGALMLDNATLQVGGVFKPNVSSWTLHRSTTQGGGSITNEFGTTLTARSSTFSDFNRVLVPITNRGNLAVTGQYNTFEYSGGTTLTNEAGADFSLAGTSTDSSAALVLQSGVTNRGTVRLTSFVSSAGASLTLNTGTFVNEPGAALAFEAGAGGSRTFSAHLDNRGTVTVNRATTMSKSSGDYDNNGSITIGAASPLTVNNINTFDNVSQITAGDGSSISLSGASSATSTFNNTGIVTAGGGLSVLNFLNVNNVASGSIQITGGSMAITAASFVNSPSASLNITAGAATTHAINADVDNRGQMNVHRNLTFDRSSVEHTNSGQVTLHGGAKLTVRQAFRNMTGGIIEGNGTVEMIVGPLRNDGTVKPGIGDALGVMSVMGSYENTSLGQLVVDVYGFVAGEYDVLNVTGGVTLGGSMHMNIPGMYQPAVGHTFDIINAGGAINVVNPVFTSSLPGFVFELDTTAPASLIRVKTTAVPPATLPGDFNNDDIVDAADYVVWRKNAGTQEEFNTWRANFGNTLGGSGSATDTGEHFDGVPEPATWGLLILGMAAISVFRRSTMS